MEEKNIIGLAATPAQGHQADQAGKPDSVDERKARLLHQADFYRVGIVRAKAGIQQGARPEALFHSALDQAGWALRTRVDSLLRPTGINVATVMPYALSAFQFLRRRHLLKPVLGVAAVVGGAAYYLRHRRATVPY